MTEPPRHCRVLIVWHSRTGAARQMAEAAEQGARRVLHELAAEDRVEIIRLQADQADTQHLLDADACLFCAPENLGALSGAMKEFFDRTYYGALNRLNGRPAAIMIAAGTDGQGAARQAERICTGWRLRLVAPVLVVNTQARSEQEILAPKQLDQTKLAPCTELGGMLAALLA